MAIDEAEREIRRTFDQSGDGIGEFNQLIEALTRNAFNSGMNRALVTALLLNQVSAVSGEGKQQARGSSEFYMYKGIQDSAQAAGTIASGLRRNER